MEKKGRSKVEEEYRQLYEDKMVAYSVFYLKKAFKKEYAKLKGNYKNLKDDEILLGKITKVPNSKRSIKFNIALLKGSRLLEGVSLGMLKNGIKRY